MLGLQKLPFAEYITVKGSLFFMLSMTIKDDDKTIYEAEGEAIMDVLLAFAMYSRYNAIVI